MRLAIPSKVMRRCFIEIIFKQRLKEVRQTEALIGKNYHIKCDNLCKNLSIVVGSKCSKYLISIGKYGYKSINLGFKKIILICGFTL